MWNLYFFRNPAPPNSSFVPQLMHNYVLSCTTCQNQINPTTLGILSEAHRAERAGRYEDAAKAYERVNLLDTARALRERGRSSTVRNVNVNVNSLIDQLKTGGLSVPYKCQGCGATITIDSNTGSGGLRYCAYCGSAINTEALASLIRSALG
jgi:DNA-directed RNA polymerase subunit RPC12/RpoP